MTVSGTYRMHADLKDSPQTLHPSQIVIHTLQHTSNLLQKRIILSELDRPVLMTSNTQID